MSSLGGRHCGSAAARSRERLEPVCCRSLEVPCAVGIWGLEIRMRNLLHGLFFMAFHGH